MSVNNMMQEIRDINLSYLMLAQHFIRTDKDEAVFRLGISLEIADCKVQSMAHLHASILLARQPVETIC